VRAGACAVLRRSSAHLAAGKRARVAHVHRPAHPLFHRPAEARLAAVDPGRVSNSPQARPAALHRAAARPAPGDGPARLWAEGRGGPAHGAVRRRGCGEGRCGLWRVRGAGGAPPSEGGAVFCARKCGDGVGGARRPSRQACGEKGGDAGAVRGLSCAEKRGQAPGRRPLVLAPYPCLLCSPCPPATCVSPSHCPPFRQGL